MGVVDDGGLHAQLITFQNHLGGPPHAQLQRRHICFDLLRRRNDSNRIMHETTNRNPRFSRVNGGESQHLSSVGLAVEISGRAIVTTIIGDPLTPAVSGELKRVDKRVIFDVL